MSGLTAGTSYTFTVVAYNKSAVSAPSSASGPVTPLSATDPLGPNTHGSTDGTAPIPAGGLLAGSSLLLVDGKAAPVKVTPNAANAKKAAGLSISGPGFTMTLAGRGDAHDPLGLTAKEVLVLQSEGVAARALDLARQRMQPVAMSTGTGFKAGSEIKFFLLADTFLGAITTDRSGNYAGQVPVPAGIAAGTYTLQVNGFAPSGEVRSLSIGVVVKTAAVARATASAGAEVFFAPMSASVSARGKATLTELVKATGRNAVRTVVIGFVQPTGGTGNDYTLSTARAQAVAKVLRGLGLRGAYSVKGNGAATKTGAEARRVDVTVTFRR